MMRSPELSLSHLLKTFVARPPQRRESISVNFSYVHQPSSEEKEPLARDSCDLIFVRLERTNRTNEIEK